jgi:hypothetical protein
MLRKDGSITISLRNFVGEGIKKTKEYPMFVQLEPNLAGMFLGWSSTKFMFFVPVGYSTWLPGPIICSDWLKMTPPQHADKGFLLHQSYCNQV